MTSIYVVYGRTGEYSDRREWPIRAFHTEPQALTFRQELLDLVRRMGVGRGQGGGRDFPTYNTEEIETEEEYAHLREDFRKLKALDPDFKTDYTGTDYSYYSVPLHEEKA